MKQFGKDVLMVTHSRDEAYRLCSRIALIDSGGIIVHKGTKELFDDPESRQAAIITGCKNIVEARKTGEFEVEAPQWGIRLKTAKPIHDGLCAIGIRAHYFDPGSNQNSYPVRFTGEMEEPFEYIMQFRFENQSEDTPDIWWQMPKNKKDEQTPAALGIASEYVLPLYE